MEEWYTGVIDTVSYNWDSGNPGVLGVTKTYQRIDFNPTVLESVQLKINQNDKSKMISHNSDLMKVQAVQDPSGLETLEKD